MLPCHATSQHAGEAQRVPRATTSSCPTDHLDRSVGCRAVILLLVGRRGPPPGAGREHYYRTRPCGLVVSARALLRLQTGRPHDRLEMRALPGEELTRP